MPVVLIIGALVLLLLLKRGRAFGDAGGTPLPGGVGTATGTWDPTAVPSFIHPISINPVTSNQYGGNEADPRIVGGTWYDDRYGATCTYDPHGGPSGGGLHTCDKVLGTPGQQLPEYKLASCSGALCPPGWPGAVTAPGPATTLKPPPPAPPAGWIPTPSGVQTVPNVAAVGAPQAQSRTGAGHF